MRRLAGHGRARWIAVAVATSLVCCAQAGAATVVSERIVRSDSGREFRALEAIDATNTSNGVLVTDSGPSLGTIYVVDTAAIASVPEGCSLTTYGPAFGPGPPGAPVPPPAAACPQADYDVYFVGAGPGRDSVVADFDYPSLGRRQVIGPKLITPMNSNLGPGADTSRSMGGGTDSAFGGTGNDVIQGGDGNDFLVGGKGADRLVGLGGADYLLGLGGRDILKAGRGTPDLMLGGGGGDRCNGNQRDRVSRCERVNGRKF